MHKSPQRQQEYVPMTGQALHAGYQNWLTHKDVDKAVLALLHAFDMTLLPKPAEQRTLEACYATLMGMIHDNMGMMEYQLAKVTHNGVETPAIEVPFEIRFVSGGQPFELLPGLGVSYIGYIDAIMHNIITDDFEVIDIKTHRRELNNMTPLYRYDEQCIPYALVLERALGRQFTSLAIRYLTAYVSVNAPIVKSYPFLKGSVDISDWARGILIKLSNIKMYLTMDWWPRNANHCVAFNQVCGYMEPCASRNKDYIDAFFAVGKDLIYHEQEFDPWFSLDLEIGAAGNG